MSKKKLKNLIKLASEMNLSAFRKTLKEVLLAKTAKRLDEKEVQLSKKLFKEKR